MIISHVGPPWGHLGTHGGPKVPLFGPKRAEIGPKIKIVEDLSCHLSKFAQEGHSANEKNIIIIWCTSSEKIKKFQLGQFRKNYQYALVVQVLYPFFVTDR